MGQLEDEALDSQAWLRPLIQDHRPMKIAERMAFPGSVPEMTQAGSGNLELREPGHPFEEYLKGVGRYRCRLGAYLRDIPGAVVLAESRMGEVVAIEVPLGNGSAVIVPPPRSEEDEKRIDAAVRRAVAQRVGARGDWVPEQERALIEARDSVLTRMRQERSVIDAQLEEVRVIKARVLDEEIVSRAASYYRQATAPGVTADRVMFFLYKITDLLRDHFGAGESGLAEALGMTVAQIKKIKKVANLPEKDLRHAGVGPTEQVTDTELSEAVSTGREMVNQLVTRRLREELARSRE